MMPVSTPAHYIALTLVFLAVCYITWFCISRSLRIRSQVFNIAFVSVCAIAACAALVDSVCFARGILDSYYGELGSVLASSWILGGVFTILMSVVFALVRWILKRMFAVDHSSGWVRILYCGCVIALYGISFYGNISGWSNLAIRTDRFVDASYIGPSVVRIAWFSDLHIGNVNNMHSLERVLAKVAAGKPNVLVVGGDLCDDRREVTAAIEYISKFGECHNIAVYYIMGNHEYYCDIAQTERALAASKIILLRDKATVIPNTNIALVGVDYPFASGRFSIDYARADIALRYALRDLPKAAVRVLLAHTPEYADLPATLANVDLMLSGHTHGGQVVLGEHNLFANKFHYVLGRYTIGTMCAIVSAGAGSWLPFRIDCPAEVNFIDISAR